ncbi:hypothetical protein [Streptomyces poonensis]|uniref:Uncharacterized protein n=1 Tax=Streptomyces poonensis TaxID=68255 RepID=A0A918UFA5_9ACTN|nr:hypothetical protein [Streptomyces poonensis]GGY99323.1 hypothetical protein GCM10010365_17510 [Streptomyces poonensis]
MSDVVDSDELLRRIQRARDWAEREERHWKARSGTSAHEDDDGARGAEVLSFAYEAVRKALEEIVRPGTHDDDPAAPPPRQGA